MKRDYPSAVKLARAEGSANAWHIREKLGITYAEAVQLIDRMERNGVVGPAEGSGPRPVLSEQGRLPMFGGEGKREADSHE